MFDFILSSILKCTVVVLVLAVCLHHNYIKLKKEGHLKQQKINEVAYSNTGEEGTDLSFWKAYPPVSEVFCSQEIMQVQNHRKKKN